MADAHQEMADDSGGALADTGSSSVTDQVGHGGYLEVMENHSCSAGPFPPPGSRSPSPAFSGYDPNMSTAAYANEPENQLGCRWLYPSQTSIQAVGFDDSFNSPNRRGSYYRSIPPSQAQPKSIADADPITQHAGATENNEKFLDGLSCVLQVGDKCLFCCCGLFDWVGFITLIDDSDPRKIRYYGDFSELPNYDESWNDHGYPRHKVSKYFDPAETSDLDQCLVRGHPLASVLSSRHQMKKGVRVLLCDHTLAYIYYNDTTCWRIGVKSEKGSRLVHRLSYLKVLCVNPTADYLSAYDVHLSVKGPEGSVPSTSRKRSSNSSAASSSKCVRVHKPKATALGSAMEAARQKPKATALGSAMEAARQLVKEGVRKAIEDDRKAREESQSQVQAAQVAEIKVEDDEDVEMETVLSPQMQLFTVEAAEAVANALLRPASVEKICKPICDRLDTLILKTSSAPEVVTTPASQERPTKAVPKAPSKAINQLFPRSVRSSMGQMCVPPSKQTEGQQQQTNSAVHEKSPLAPTVDPSVLKLNLVTPLSKQTEGQQQQANSALHEKSPLAPTVDPSVLKPNLVTPLSKQTEGQQQQANSAVHEKSPLAPTVDPSVLKSNLVMPSSEPTENQQQQTNSAVHEKSPLAPTVDPSVLKSNLVMPSSEPTENQQQQANSAVHEKSPLAPTVDPSVLKSNLVMPSSEPTENQQQQANSAVREKSPLAPTVEPSVVKPNLVMPSLEPTENQQQQANSAVLADESIILSDNSCNGNENLEPQQPPTDDNSLGRHSDGGGSTMEAFKTIEFSTSLPGNSDLTPSGGAPTLFTRESVEGGPPSGGKWKDGERSWLQLVEDLGGEKGDESPPEEENLTSFRNAGTSKDEVLGGGIDSSEKAKVDVKEFDFKLQLPLQPYLVPSVKSYLTKPKPSPMASTLRPGASMSNVLSLKGGVVVGPLQSLNLSPVHAGSDGDTNDAFRFAEESFLDLSNDEDPVEYCPFEIIFDNTNGRRVCSLETARKVFDNNPLMRIEVPNFNGVCALRLTVGSVVWVENSFSESEFGELAGDAYSVAVSASTPVEQVDVFLNTLMTNFYKPFPTPIEYGKSPRGGKITKRTRIMDLHLDHEPPFNSFIRDAFYRFPRVGGHSVMEVHGRIASLMRQLQRNRRNAIRYAQMRFSGLNPKQCDKGDDGDDSEDIESSANF